MSRPANQANRRRRPADTAARRPVDLWRPVPALPEPTPIEPATDPTALLRSLGDPPLAAARVAATHHLAAVVERASALAAALAASADLLAQPDEPA